MRTVHDGSYAYVDDQDGKVYVYRTSDGQSTREWSLHSENTNRVQIALDDELGR